MSTYAVRRNVLLLACCQALFMTSTSAIIASAPIIGAILLVEDKALVTLPLALQFVAMALTTIPASLYMGRAGRRAGFITGALIGAAGGVVGAWSIMRGDFALFCVASMLTGSFNGFCHYFRFAAADASPPEASIRCAVSAAASPSMSKTPTPQPSSPKRSEMARPMAPPPPVMIAFLPVSPRMPALPLPEF